MSPVTFIKRECDRHPGCYTMTDRCERCHAEDFARSMDEIFAKWRREVRRVLREPQP